MTYKSGEQEPEIQREIDRHGEQMLELYNNLEKASALDLTFKDSKIFIFL